MTEYIIIPIIITIQASISSLSLNALISPYPTVVRVVMAQ